MKIYNSSQQLQIFNNCKTATELLHSRTCLEDTQNITYTALMVYDLKMEIFLIHDLI